MNKLFLTGRPRSGKSTLIQTCLAGFQYPLGGFAVQRLTSHGETWAFRLLDLAEEDYVTHLESSREFEDIVIFMAAPGKWQGISAVFDGKGKLAIDRCLGTNKLVVLDELGIFERDAQAFQASVFEVLDNSMPVLGVIKDKSSPFLDSVRRHPAVELRNFPHPDAETAVRTLLAEAGH